MEELKKYVESINSIVFRMALSQLMVMGVENASKISDEDIENCKENDEYDNGISLDDNSAVIEDAN